MNKLIILSILISIGIAIYLIIEFKVKKWKCTEGTCEKVIGGDFASLEKCRKMCKIRQDYNSRAHNHKKKVKWATDLIQYEPDS